MLTGLNSTVKTIGGLYQGFTIPAIDTMWAFGLKNFVSRAWPVTVAKSPLHKLRSRVYRFGVTCVIA